MTFGDIFHWLKDRLYDLWPVRVIRTWEQGLRVRAGNVHRVLTSANGLGGTGIHVFVPLVDEVVTVNAAIRAAESALQRLTTRDGVDVSVAFTLTYQIRDLRAVTEKVHDFADSVLDRIRGAAGQVVPALLWEELEAKLAPEMDATLRKKVRGWGLDLIELVPTSLSRAPALHVLGTDRTTGES